MVGGPAHGPRDDVVQLAACKNGLLHDKIIGGLPESFDIKGETNFDINKIKV